MGASPKKDLQDIQSAPHSANNQYTTMAYCPTQSQKSPPIRASPQQNRHRLPPEIAQLEAASAEAANAEANAETPADSRGEVINLNDFRTRHVNELAQMAQEAGINNASRLRKQDLIFNLVKARAKQGGSIYGGGILEVLPEHYGFLRYPDSIICRRCPGDIYVSPQQIKKFRLTNDRNRIGRSSGRK